MKISPKSSDKHGGGDQYKGYSLCYIQGPVTGDVNTYCLHICKAGKYYRNKVTTKAFIHSSPLIKHS